MVFQNTKFAQARKVHETITDFKHLKILMPDKISCKVCLIFKPVRYLKFTAFEDLKIIMPYKGSWGGEEFSVLVHVTSFERKCMERC